MEPSRKKGTFISYSKSSKSYRIYVPGERHIEFNGDVTFHEESTLKHSKDTQYDTDMEEHETPKMEDPYLGSSLSNVERQKLEEFSNLIEELVESVER